MVSHIWRSLGSIFPRGKRRKSEADFKLTMAYRSVFNGHPSREDQEIVLADIAKESGFYRVTDAEFASSKQLWQAEGKRLLYASIFSRLALAEADLRALETAARRESAVDLDPMENN